MRARFGANSKDDFFNFLCTNTYFQRGPVKEVAVWFQQSGNRCFACTSIQYGNCILLHLPGYNMLSLKELAKTTECIGAEGGSWKICTVVLY